MGCIIALPLSRFLYNMRRMTTALRFHSRFRVVEQQHSQMPCVPQSRFHSPESVWKILFFKGNQWPPGVLSKTEPVRSKGPTGELVEPSHPKRWGLRVGSSLALCSCVQKRTWWLIDFHLSQSKDTFSCLFSAGVGAHSRTGDLPPPLRTHCHLLALCIFTPRNSLQGQSHGNFFPDSLVRDIRKQQ